MTGVAHLSTGLYLKAKFPRAPLHLLILAAGAPDLVWATINLAPVPAHAPLEVARVAMPYEYIGSLQLILEPLSHALLSTTVLGTLLAAIAYLAFRRVDVAAAVLLAALGHWMLDYFVHDADLMLWPFQPTVRVGPGFVLDAADPARGLSAGAPLVGFLLQTAVVVGSTAVFLRSFPVPTRKGRILFWVVMIALAFTALPVFIKGALTGMITSTQAFVMGALGEKFLAWIVIAVLARKVIGAGLPSTPFAGRNSGDDGEARVFARHLLETAGAIAFLVAGAYLLQSMRDAKALPAVGAASIALGLAYLLLGGALVRKNPSMLWAAIGVALVAGPVARIVWQPGSLGGALTVLELALGALSVYLVRTLLRRDLLL
jgi:hypothetical protein